MKKRLIKSKEKNSEEETSKDSKEKFTIDLKQKAIEPYNMRASKKDMKNSLSSKEIHNIDKDFMPQIMPKEAKLAQYDYSVDSKLFNEYFRGFSKETLMDMRELDTTIKDVEKMIIDLKKSIIRTKKDYIVYRGVIGKFDVNRFNKSGGFIATSFDKAIAKGYTRGKGEVIAIKVPKGTPVMYIRHNSIYPDHIELLIPDNYSNLRKVIKKSRTYYVVTKKKLNNS